MQHQGLIARLTAVVRRFLSARDGNVAMIFGIAAVPLMVGVGAAVDYSHANSVKTAMQAALDSTALALVKTASSSTSAQLTTSASTYFAATFNRPEAQNVQVSAQYDTSSGILSVTGSATMPTNFVGLIGMSNITLSGLSKATTASKTWPVCVLIANNTDKHTLFTDGTTANITFNNCMVQVNTTDFDAVEARSTTYIHSTNGENCFVGEIHYGDVLPPKDPSCTFFPDPFAGYAMPASAATCTYTNLSVIGTTTMQPGTYCGNTTINGSTVTLSPGLYIIKNGNWTMKGTTTVVANGVTFVLTGTAPNFYVTNTVHYTQTPMTSGQFAGFALYLDNNVNPSCSFSDGGKVAGQKLPNDCINAIDSSANVTITGIVYLANSVLLADDTSIMNVTGSLVSQLLVAHSSAQISITGAMPNSSTAAAAMQKQSQNGTGSLRLVN